MDICFVIVSWNVRDLLRRALQSILTDAAPFQYAIIVVDNASRDGTREMLAAEFPTVRVIANAENCGFTRANNQGMALAMGRAGAAQPDSVPTPEPPRYLFLLNPDTELYPGATRALLEYMDAPENARVGIVGPQLVYPDGSIQSSRRRLPTFATALLESTVLQRWFPHNRVLDRYYMRDTSDDAVQDAAWVVGAAMFVRAEVYAQTGGFDEQFFMYSEELDWCQRAGAAGWRVVYFPRARVKHYEARSSEQVRAERDIYFHSSKVRYFKKYHGAFQGELLRWFLLGTFVFQTAEEGLKYVLGHKRALRAERLRAYRRVLSSGLK